MAVKVENGNALTFIGKLLGGDCHVVEQAKAASPAGVGVVAWWARQGEGSGIGCLDSGTNRLAGCLIAARRSNRISIEVRVLLAGGPYLLDVLRAVDQLQIWRAINNWRIGQISKRLEPFLALRVHARVVFQEYAIVDELHLPGSGSVCLIIRSRYFRVHKIKAFKPQV